MTGAPVTTAAVVSCPGTGADAETADAAGRGITPASDLPCPRPDGLAIDGATGAVLEDAVDFVAGGTIGLATADTAGVAAVVGVRFVVASLCGTVNVLAGPSAAGADAAGALPAGDTATASALAGGGRRSCPTPPSTTTSLPCDSPVVSSR